MPTVAEILSNAGDVLPPFIVVLRHCESRMRAILNQGDGSTIPGLDTFVLELQQKCQNAENCWMDMENFETTLSEVESFVRLGGETSVCPAKQPVKTEEHETSDLVMRDAPSSNLSGKNVESSNSKEPMVKRESQRSPLAQPKRERSSLPRNAGDATQAAKRRRMHMKEEPHDANNELATSSFSPEVPSGIRPMPEVEYEDIDAEVEGRLQKNEERRRRQMNREINPSTKRKRSSGSSAAARSSLSGEAAVQSRSEQARHTKKMKSVMRPVAGNLGPRIRREQGPGDKAVKGKLKRSTKIQ